jgi:H/ACA ribonucleoprotein complex subunit 1
MGSVMHSCENEIVCESINPKIPYFNAPIYLENKVRQRSRYNNPSMIVAMN